MPTTMKKGHPFSCCSSLKGTLPQKREKRAPPGNEEHLAFRGHGTKTKHGAGGGGWGGETTAKGTYSMFLPKNVETAASFRKASASNTRNTTKFHLRDSQKWEGHPKSLRFVGKKNPRDFNPVPRRKETRRRQKSLGHPIFTTPGI